MFLALKNPFQGYTEFCAKTRLQSVQTGKFRISVTEGSQVKGRGMARSKAKNEKMEKKTSIVFYEQHRSSYSETEVNFWKDNTLRSYEIKLVGSEMRLVTRSLFLNILSSVVEHWYRKLVLGVMRMTSKPEAESSTLSEGNSHVFLMCIYIDL